VGGRKGRKVEERGERGLRVGSGRRWQKRERKKERRETKRNNEGERKRENVCACVCLYRE